MVSTSDMAAPQFLSSAVIVTLGSELSRDVRSAVLEFTKRDRCRVNPVDQGVAFGI